MGDDRYLSSSAPFASNLYNSRLGTYSYRLPLGPNIYNRLPQGQAQIFTTAYRLAGTTTAAVLWQLARQNNPKSNLVPGGTKFDFWNPTTPLSCSNWHRPVAAGTTLKYFLPLTASPCYKDCWWRDPRSPNADYFRGNEGTLGLLGV